MGKKLVYSGGKNDVKNRGEKFVNEVENECKIGQKLGVLEYFILYYKIKAS